MKKLALIFSLAFFAFVVSASAQSSASDDKGTAATEKVNCDDGTKAKAKAKGCCMHSSKAKCYSKDKSEAKRSEATSNTEAVVSEQKSVVAETESK